VVLILGRAYEDLCPGRNITDDVAVPFYVQEFGSEVAWVPGILASDRRPGAYHAALAVIDRLIHLRFCRAALRAFEDGRGIAEWQKRWNSYVDMLGNVSRYDVQAMEYKLLSRLIAEASKPRNRAASKAEQKRLAEMQAGIQDLFEGVAERGGAK
jgi:hypothetical protein